MLPKFVHGGGRWWWLGLCWLEVVVGAVRPLAAESPLEEVRVAVAAPAAAAAAPAVEAAAGAAWMAVREREVGMG